jgi:serine/threonine protein kinase
MVVHRDIKPANILIDPVTLTLRVADFGLSRIIYSRVVESDGSDDDIDNDRILVTAAAPAVSYGGLAPPSSRAASATTTRTPLAPTYEPRLPCTYFQSGTCTKVGTHSTRRTY